MQEILQANSDQKLWSSKLERWRKSGLAAQHHDGPKEVLQSSLPLPRCLNGEKKQKDTFVFGDSWSTERVDLMLLKFPVLFQHLLQDLL